MGGELQPTKAMRSWEADIFRNAHRLLHHRRIEASRKRGETVGMPASCSQPEHSLGAELKILKESLWQRNFIRCGVRGVSDTRYLTETAGGSSASAMVENSTGSRASGAMTR